MIRYEDQCVGCPPEMGCLGSSCPYSNVPVIYCDSCLEIPAKYMINGEMLCKKCTKSTLKQLFYDMPIEEQAKALNVDMEVISL